MKFRMCAVCGSYILYGVGDRVHVDCVVSLMCFVVIVFNITVYRVCFPLKYSM